MSAQDTDTAPSLDTPRVDSATDDPTAAPISSDGPPLPDSVAADIEAADEAESAEQQQADEQRRARAAAAAGGAAPGPDMLVGAVMAAAHGYVRRRYPGMPITPEEDREIRGALTALAAWYDVDIGPPWCYWATLGMTVAGGLHFRQQVINAQQEEADDEEGDAPTSAEPKEAEGLTGGEFNWQAAVGADDAKAAA